MKVIFNRWSVQAEARTPVAVEPSRVEVVEHYSPAFDHAGERFPASCRIVMMGKQEYIVQGSVEVVTHMLNAAVANAETTRRAR